MTLTAAAAVPRLDSVADEVVRLVEAAQRDDRAAFAELYTRYVRVVHGIVLSRMSNFRADVEDLVHDVFLVAMQRLPGLRNPSAFGGWLAAIARNHAVDYLRRTPKTAELPADVASHDTDHTEALAILAVIQELPDAYRETLTLRLVEGMTGPEIAACTGMTEGSVRVNLHRGMKQLRERLTSERRSS